MNNNELQEMKKYMRTAKISFSYKKINGEIRNAIGTLDMQYIDEKNAHSNGLGKEIKGIFKYFDVEKEAWRSCLDENIIEYKKPDAIQLDIYNNI